MIHPQHATSAIVATEVNDLLYNSTMATAAIPLDLTTTPSSEALPPLAFEVEIVESTEFEDGDHSLDSSEVSLDETSQVIPLTKVQSTGSSTTESISMYSDQISGYSDDTSCYSDSYSGLPATTTSVVLDTPIITQTSMPSLESTSYEPLVVTSDGTVIVATETPVVPLETPIDLTVPSTSSASAVLSVDVPVSADGTVDETLARAAMEAVTTGKMTLLIKEELRCTIQTKRLSEGKDELEVTVDDKVEPECLSTEEEVKRKRRRERNKFAAQRCRNRKRDLADQLEQETEDLESANKKLKTDIDELFEEKEKLILMLRRHDVTFRKCGRKLSDNLEDD